MAYSTVKELFVAICDSIRSKKGTTELINHQDIPEEVVNVFDSGRTEGYMDGSSEGYSKGYREGYEVAESQFPVKGTFVPEDDTKIFDISGLSFTPTSLFIMCSDECVSSGNGTPSSIICINKPKELRGFVQHRDDSLTVNIAYLGVTSSMFAWSENGVKVTIPIDRYFKKGLVYNYYVLGGGE